VAATQQKQLILAEEICRKLEEIRRYIKDVSHESKVMFYKSTVQSAVIYNQQPWTLKGIT